MPNYRRLCRCGGTYFITIVTYRRRPLFNDAFARRCLHEAIAATLAVFPFVIEELVLLLDHLHLILTLPDGDNDFSTRIRGSKTRFTRAYLAGGGEELSQGQSRSRQHYRGVWQKRFWEHLMRGQNDLGDCRKYCWYNPVKHGLVKCPHDWPYSTFHGAVKRGRVDSSWACVCRGAPAVAVRDVRGAEAD